MRLRKLLLILISLLSATIITFSHSEDMRSDFVDTLIEPYMEVSGALKRDDLQSARDLAYELIKAIRLGPSRAGRPNLLELEIGAHKIKQSKDLLAARDAFYDSSKALEHLIMDVGVKGDVILYTLYCPMALDNRGAIWIQDSRNISNPYIGDEMIDCGQEKEQLTGPRDSLNLLSGSIRSTNLVEPREELLEEQGRDYPPVCVVSDEPLVEGEYLEYEYEGKLIRFCCKGCKRDFLDYPKGYMMKLEKLRSAASNLEQDRG